MIAEPSPQWLIDAALRRGRLTATPQAESMPRPGSHRPGCLWFVAFDSIPENLELDYPRLKRHIVPGTMQFASGDQIQVELGNCTSLLLLNSPSDRRVSSSHQHTVLVDYLYAKFEALNRRIEKTRSSENRSGILPQVSPQILYTIHYLAAGPPVSNASQGINGHHGQQTTFLLFSLCKLTQWVHQTLCYRQKFYERYSIKDPAVVEQLDLCIGQDSASFSAMNQQCSSHRDQINFESLSANWNL